MVEQLNQESSSGSLDELEDKLRGEIELSGFELGLEMGRNAGQDEGYSRGLEEGAKIGSEIGFYRGFTMTWIQLLQSNPSIASQSTKILNILKECLNLVESAPKTNETICDEILSRIRVKFKQSTSLLNLKQ